MKRIILAVIVFILLPWSTHAAVTFYDSTFYFVTDSSVTLGWTDGNNPQPDGWEVLSTCVETNQVWSKTVTAPTAVFTWSVAPGDINRVGHFKFAVRGYRSSLRITHDGSGEITSIRIRAKSTTPTTSDPYVNIPVTAGSPIVITYQLPGSLSIPTSGSYYIGLSAVNASGESSMTIAQYRFVVSAGTTRIVSDWHESIQSNAKIYSGTQYIRDGGWMIFKRPSTPIIQ